jgi:hypothetical protein
VYTLTGTSTLGCSSNALVNVTTYSLPLISISPSTVGACLNAEASFTASGADTYTWNTGAPYAAITVTASASAVYTVTGTSSNGCNSTQTLALVAYPLPTVAISPASPTVCAKDLLTMTASGANTYTWLPTITNTVALSITPTVNTTYTVLANDANNCAGKAVVYVLVDPCTGIEHNGGLKNLVSLYPNPSNGMIMARFEFEGEKEITVTNSAGALIGEYRTPGYNENIDLSARAKGIYFVKVSTKTASANYRIIIQ